MGDITDVKARLSVFAQDDGGEDTINGLTDIYVQHSKASADAMASTTTADTLIWCNPYDFSLRVVSARIVSASALTAHDTDFATITVKTDNGANGSPATALTWETTTTGTGSWATDVAEAATVTAANATLVAGGCLHFNIAKGGSGVVVPASLVVIRLRRV